MLNILYWNVGLRKGISNINNLATVLRSLSVDRYYSPDVIFLSDFDHNLNETIVLSLMPHGYEPFFPSNFGVYQARCIVAFYKAEITFEPQALWSKDNFAVYEIMLQNGIDSFIRLIPVHFRSKLWTNERTRERTIESEVKELQTIIKQRPARTFIFGDFNSNPWDEVMIDPHYFNAAPVPLSEKLYNPTWALLGNYKPNNGEIKPAASYFFETGIITHNYNMFDQLLMPFDSIPYFDRKSFQLLDRVRDIKLWDYTKEKVNKKDTSDHLPLFFRIKNSD